jgi:hypothetical protein
LISNSGACIRKSDLSADVCTQRFNVAADSTLNANIQRIES